MNIILKTGLASNGTSMNRIALLVVVIEQEVEREPFDVCLMFQNRVVQENKRDPVADPGLSVRGVLSRYKRGWVREGRCPLPLQLGGRGERCKLPHWGLGRSPRSFSSFALLSFRRIRISHTFSSVPNRNMNSGRKLRMRFFIL